MKTRALSLSVPFVASLRFASLVLSGSLALLAQPDPSWLGHDRTRPLPPVVDPGVASTQDQAGKAPSDAVVLFDGKDLSAWVATDGNPTKWVVKNGAMECVPGSGYVRTLQAFGDCQLHLEFAAPTPPEGSSQGRGNSGVFFGGTRYEIQVLDSYQNKTYADGSAASVYCQYPPLVNASRPPGQWQSYDIVWTAPRFESDQQRGLQSGAKLKSPAYVTVFHNGVLVQNHVELTGGTGWLERSPYSAHPEKLPISLQDHGNPVRYRNLWVRELGKGKAEFQLPEAVLNSYVGNYERGRNDVVKVERGGDGVLRMSFSGAQFVMYAQSPTRFFAKTTDVQAEFGKDAQGNVGSVTLSVGEDGGMRCQRMK
jgi:hypothetical protein